jgi:hypothetical protein
MVVSSLICHRHVPMAIKCLGSLVTAVGNIQFQLHDDGSLSLEDIQLLKEALPVQRLISRAEADEVVTAACSDFPHLLAYRRSCVMGLKLLDIAWFHPNATLAYLDADIFFLRRVPDFFQALNGYECVFMRDIQSAYAIRPWHLIGAKAIPMVARLNAGIILAQKNAINRAVFEAFLEQRLPVFQRLGIWLEQSCWAHLAATRKAGFFHESQIAIPTSFTQVHHLTAAHFVSDVRESLSTSEQYQRFDQAPVPLKTAPFEMLQPLPFALSLLGKKLKRAIRG